MKTKIKYKTLSATIFAIFAILCVCCAMYLSFNDKEYTVTITDKERIVEVEDGEISSKYLVWGEDRNGEILVFRNTDEWVRGKWNSSTIQGSLKEGRTYKITVVGIRIPFLSCYENIISFEELNGGAE